MEEEPAGPSTVQNESEEEEDDTVLANSEFLTRQELLKRRSKRLRRLAKCYRDHYWLLMEELKKKHREYYWKYGKSPFKDEDEAQEERENHVIQNNNNNIHHQSIGNGNGNGEIVSSKLGLGLAIGGSFNQCAFPGCGSKAMALSKYCHPHILSDTKQKLYKSCKFVLKPTGAGPITCGKPILISTVPSLCPAHHQRLEKLMRGHLRKEGASVAPSNKLASKFHLVIAEYVKLIQSKRASASVNMDSLAANDGGS